MNLENYTLNKTGKGFKQGQLLSKKTTPPQHYTEASLLKDMENAQKFTNLEHLKQSLKQTNGIGTPATRAGIIEKIKGKTGKVQYLIEKQGKLLASQEAITIIDYLSTLNEQTKQLTDVSTTAFWEEALADIEEGKLTYEEFYKKQCQQIKDLITNIFQTNTKTIKEIKFMENSTFFCKDVNCDKDGNLIYHADGKFGPYWACSAKNKDDEICQKCKLKGSQDKPEREILNIFACADVGCEKNGKLIYHSDGKFGPYWSCSAKNKEDEICQKCKLKGDASKPSREIQNTFSCADVGCDRNGTLTYYPNGKFGPFWGCSTKNKEDSQCKMCKLKGSKNKPERIILEEVEPLPTTGETCPLCKKGTIVTKKITKPDSKAFGKRFLSCNIFDCKYFKGEWEF